jgi:hypothetical protein
MSYNHSLGGHVAQPGVGGFLGVISYLRIYTRWLCSPLCSPLTRLCKSRVSSSLTGLIVAHAGRLSPGVTHISPWQQSRAEMENSQGRSSKRENFGTMKINLREYGMM